MNLPQKRSLLIGLIVLVIMWLFPPWIHSGHKLNGIGRIPVPHHRTGYFLLTDSAQGEPILDRIGRMTFTVDVPHLAIQCLIVIALTAGAVLILGSTKKP